MYLALEERGGTLSVRESIFDSKAEKRVFEELAPHINHPYVLQPQVPVRSVINLDKLDLEDWENDILLKSTFVFVIFDHSDGFRPIAVLEFDGIGGGYSDLTQYHQQRAVEYDPKRKNKLDRKTRSCNLPMVVFSYEELNKPLLLRAIAHTMISMRVGKQKMDLLAKPLGRSAIEASVHCWENELIFDRLLQAELEAEFECNATLRECLAIEAELLKRDLYPKMMQISPERESDRFTIRYTLALNNGVAFSAKITVRDFFNAGVVAELIAEYCVLLEAAKTLQHSVAKTSISKNPSLIGPQRRFCPLSAFLVALTKSALGCTSRVPF